MPARSAKARRVIATGLIEKIENMIVLDGIKPGARVATQKLADQFQVSRSPINQALKALCAKGVLEHLPQRGFRMKKAVGNPVKEKERADNGREERIYLQMVEDRLNGVLETQVSKRILRARYKLSDLQIKHLMKRVVGEGWAERRPGYGWIFSSISATPDALEQCFRFRLAIEPAAIMEPTFYLDVETARRHIAVEMRILEAGVDKVSPSVLFNVGVDFHEMLAAASQNSFFLDAVKRINRMRRLLTYRSIVNHRRYSQSKTHLEIIDLLLSGEKKAAAEALRIHLSEALASVQGLPLSPSVPSRNRVSAPKTKTSSLRNEPSRVRASATRRKLSRRS